MTGKYFLDTNFLVYCFSEDEPEKQAACLRILQEGQGKAHFVLSTWYEVLKVEFAIELQASSR
jgi:predicted nucleic acid-binding protein